MKDRLNILFNRYNLSSKATRNFINFFMKNSEFRVNPVYVGYEKEISFDESEDQYNKEIDFVNNKNSLYEYWIKLADVTDGQKASCTVNNITVECVNDNPIANDLHVKISRTETKIHIIVYGDEYVNEYDDNVYVNYYVNKSRWTNEKLSQLYPEGIPSDIAEKLQNNELHDFEPELINRDFTYVTDVEDPSFKISGIIQITCEPFDIDELQDEALVFDLQGAEQAIYKGQPCRLTNVCLTDNEPESDLEDLQIQDGIYNTKCKDGALYLVIKSKVLGYRYIHRNEESSNSIVLLPKVDEAYAAVVPRYISTKTSGYSICVPYSNKKSLKKTKPNYFYAESEDKCSGLLFYTTDLYEKDINDLRLEITRVPSYISADVGVNAIICAKSDEYNSLTVSLTGTSSGNDQNCTISVSNNSNVLTTDTFTISGDEIDGGKVYVNTLSNKISNTTAADYIDFLTRSIASGEGYITINELSGSGLQSELSVSNKLIAKISIYKNNVLYLQSWNLVLNKLNGDVDSDIACMAYNYWQNTNNRYNNYNSVEGLNQYLIGNVLLRRVIGFDENTDEPIFASTSENTGLRLNFEIGRPWGAHSNFILDFRPSNTIVYNFVQMNNELVQSDGYGNPLCNWTSDTVNSEMTIYKSGFPYKNNLYDFNSKKSLNIPVTLQLPNNRYDYINLNHHAGDNQNAVCLYSNNRVDYSLVSKHPDIEYKYKTDTFTIHDLANENELQVYYKLGFYALDGTNESCNSLADDFIDKSRFIVSLREPNKTSANASEELVVAVERKLQYIIVNPIDDPDNPNTDPDSPNTDGDINTDGLNTDGNDIISDGYYDPYNQDTSGNDDIPSKEDPIIIPYPIITPAKEDTYSFYTVSDNIFRTDDLYYNINTPIILTKDSHTFYLVCNSILLPLIKYNVDEFNITKELSGYLYMQLYDADTNTEINDDEFIHDYRFNESLKDNSLEITEIND